MSQRAMQCLTALLYGAAAAGAVWLAVRILLPWTAPLLVAFAFAALVEPLVAALHRRGLPRGAASGILTLLALALLLTGLFFLASRGVSALSGLLAALPEQAEALGRALSGLEERLLRAVSRAAGGSAWLKTALDAAADALLRIPAEISRGLPGLLTRLAQAGPDLLLFAVTAGIGGYFVSADYPRVLAFLRAQLPDGLLRRLEGFGSGLKGSFGGWLRAQLILMAITFFELLGVFLLLHVRGAALIAALTALVDALPVFGTGAVLVPWALAQLLLGETGRGLVLLIAWALICLVRSCIQAKLVGDQIGLDPIASLLAVYAGWRVCGVWGTLSFPILLVTLQQLNDKGVIRLWKKA